MNLTKGMRKKLVEEIIFAADNLNKANNPIDKMYFFSVAHATVQRIFNLEFDPELVFIHNVFENTFNAVSNKLSPSAPKGIATSIPAGFFEKLEECMRDLADKIKSDEKTYEVLEKVSNLGFTANGNGMYLYFKGELKI